MIYKVTLEHTCDGKVKATKSLDLQSNDTNILNVVCEALDIACSSQGGMFRTMTDGKHNVEAISVVDVANPTVELYKRSQS